MVTITEWWMNGGGGAISDIIDPTDGFHPSQAGMAIQASYMWDMLLKDRTDILGPRNPFNNQILTRFQQYTQVFYFTSIL